MTSIAFDPIATVHADAYVPLDPVSVRGYLARFWQGKDSAGCDPCRDERRRTGSIIARCPWHNRTPGEQAEIGEQMAEYEARRAADPSYAFGDEGEWDAPHRGSYPPQVVAR